MNGDEWLLPSGKPLQKTMERSTILIAGKTHDLNGYVYVRLPEGNKCLQNRDNYDNYVDWRLDYVNMRTVDGCEILHHQFGMLKPC